MNSKTLRFALFFATICAGAAVGVFVLKRAAQDVQDIRRTPYVFKVSDDRLREELALQYARKALAKCKTVHVLEPVEDDRATPPDRFLVRNRLDHNSGWILFRANDSNIHRDVSVSLSGNQLTCVVVSPK